MPQPEPTPITQDEYGADVHESFAVASFNHVSSHPGVELFDSSVRHDRYVTLNISRATRNRSHYSDRISDVGGEHLIEVSMSQAQFGALVSSFGKGTGVPVTISRFDKKLVPTPENETPRLAVTAQEVSSATSDGIAEVKAKLDKLEAALDPENGRPKIGVIKGAVSTLSAAIGNLPANMRFAADALTEHSENVVTKAKADIEAMAVRAAAAEGRELAEPTLVGELLAGDDNA